MDGIEKAIRSALDKGNAGEQAFREQVYRRAFEALDRALQKNPGVTVETAIRRRNSLKQRVAEIEQEFLPAVEPALPQQDLDTPVSDMPDIDVADRAPAGAAVVAPRERRPRRRFARVFVTATLVAILAIGGWWVVDGGLLRSAAERDTSVPNPPATVEDEDYRPDAATGGNSAPALPQAVDADRNWITVFDPADPTSATAAGDSVAEVVQSGDAPYLRARSGASGSAVVFDVGQGVLEQLSGKTAVFVIDAGIEEGKPTQIAVDCNFGNLGDCGRKRYVVDQDRGDFLFEVIFDDQGPGAAGSIAIIPDVEGEGRAVDIYAIRVSVSR